MKKLLLLLITPMLPLVAWCADGDIFFANTMEGVEMKFTVTNEAKKECQVGTGVGSAINKSTTGAITIPSEVYGYSVTRIGDNAFANCTELFSVTIPSSVTRIGNNAFNNSGWYNNQPDGILYLDKCLLGYKGTTPTGILAIEEGTRVIGDYAFCSCYDLTSVAIPNSVTSIGSSAFSQCYSLTTLTIPNSVTNIGDCAFYYTGWYDKQPKGILYLDNWLLGFKGSVPEGNLVIKEGTKGVADFAFDYCASLTSITIPNSLTNIGYYSFRNCSSLVSIVIESGNLVYDSRDNCNAIIHSATNEVITGCQNTAIPNSVRGIGPWAFSGCAGLTSITIPNSVTNIGTYAFQDCIALTSFIVPNSVTSIERSAFYGCNSLTSVTFHCAEIWNWFSCITSIKEVIIGNEVTSIGAVAFEWCTGLTSVTIPNSVTSIGNSAFRYCI